MSNLADLLNDIGSGNAAPTAALGDLIGTISDVSGVLGTVGAVVSILNLLTGGDSATAAQVQEILTTIQNDFAQLNAADKAQSLIAALTNVTNALGPAKTAMDNLKASVNAQPPLTAAGILEQIGPCETAINQLSADIIWTVVYSYQIYWTDALYGDQAPTGSSTDLVFNYTYVLPAYMYALFAFLSVAGCLNPTFATEYADTIIRPAASLLQAKHDTIFNGGGDPLSSPNGIVRLFPWYPGQSNKWPWRWNGQLLWQLRSSPQKGFYPPGMSALSSPDGVNIEYGAVETYSGYSSIANYALIFSSAFSSDSTDSAPFNKFQIRFLKRAKDVYVGVGLLAVWNTINKLKALVGDPLVPRPNFADWSFRNDIAPLVANGLDAPTSLRSVANLINNTPPADVPQNAFIPYLSFRSLLSI
jgi:hypothetical protein